MTETPKPTYVGDAETPPAWALAYDWPADGRFTFADDPGEHDPCYVVMPGGAMLPVNHHAGEGVDIARARFIVDACNAALDRAGYEAASARPASGWVPKPAYIMSQPHLSGFRVIIGYETLADAQAAHSVLAAAPPPPVGDHKALIEAMGPFADFGEFLSQETEGAHDLDQIELRFEESDVLLGRLSVGAFRLAAALSQRGADEGAGGWKRDYDLVQAVNADLGADNQALRAEIGRLKAALKEIKALKPAPIGDTGFSVGPQALLNAAQRIARQAILPGGE